MEGDDEKEFFRKDESLRRVEAVPDDI